jgi:hypothetical protein
MKRKGSKKTHRKMNPVFLIFCEGETEETYINFIRLGKYHRPIKLIPRVIGSKISPNIIRRFIQAEQIGPGDKITSFLMYDLDKNDIARKLADCKNSVRITSNPCLELWYLLHNDVQDAAISTDACIERLKKSSPDWSNYKKGSLTEKQKKILRDGCGIACGRAKKLSEDRNPSSSVYKLVEAIDTAIL